MTHIILIVYKHLWKEFERYVGYSEEDNKKKTNGKTLKIM